jgi:hypothetical protein
MISTDELFNKFWGKLFKGSLPKVEIAPGCHPKSIYMSDAESVFEELIAPHLNIPRSIKADPPKAGVWVIILSESSVSLAQYPTNYHESSWTHWIPLPELPQIDKDEQEFEAWVKTTDIWGNYGKGREPNCFSAIKRAWLAARGRK